MHIKCIFEFMHIRFLTRGFAGNLYTGYQLDIRGLSNGYEEKIDQISIKYPTDFSIILKISAGYSWIFRYQRTVVKE